MADAATTETPVTVTEYDRDNSSTHDTAIETPNVSPEEKPSEAAVNGVESKRAREEGPKDEDESGGGKKQRTEKSVDGESQNGPVSIGPKCFSTSVEMFDYFYKFLHHWPPNVNINQYEHKVLLELLKKGHPEPEKKIGEGISCFQVRTHPKFKSRCFFITRNDGSEDDFSFRKCVDQILPLPENMQVKHDVNKVLGGGGRGHGQKGGGGGRGGGRAGGRGGRG